MFSRIAKIYELVQAGEYQEAAHELYLLVGEVMGWTPGTRKKLTLKDAEAADATAKLEEIRAAVDTPSATAAGVWKDLIMVLIPILLDWLSKRDAGE